MPKGLDPTEVTAVKKTSSEMLFCFNYTKVTVREQNSIKHEFS